MEPIEPVSEENSNKMVTKGREEMEKSDKNDKREKDNRGETGRYSRPFFGVFTEMVSTISPALMLFFLIISANNAGDIFSCQLRVFLKNNMIVKHVLGFCILYIFVISQNSFGERYRHPTIQLGLSLLIYIWFIGIMRAPLEITIISLSTIFVIYLIHVHQLYYYPEEKLESDPTSVQITNMKVLMFIATTVLSLVGIYYFNAKCKREYGDKFNYQTYLVGLNNDICYRTSEEHSLFDEKKKKKVESGRLRRKTLS